MRAFAQGIVETVRHPLLVLDRDLRVVQANPPFYQAFAAAPADTLGRPLAELPGGPWALPGLRALLEDVLPRGGHFENFEAEADVPGRGRRALVLAARRVHGDEDGAPMVLLAIEDRTDRPDSRDGLRRANAELEAGAAGRAAELEAAVRDLQAANRELEAFAYSVSHDLRSPLRAIDGYARILLEDDAPHLPPDAQARLRAVRDNAVRMGRLIDELLAFSRLGRQPVHKRAVDPAALVRQALAELEPDRAGRAVAVEVGDLPPCRADPGLLRQKWVNLLSNALKFTRKRDDARVEVGGRGGDGGPTYWVRDNGAGFDMKYAGQLFGVFQRLHKATEFEGTGVGLATVQRVVHRHGGRVWAEAEKGRGATFYFTLPAAGGAAGGRADAPAQGEVGDGE